jgi:hypothetical protein
LAISAAAFSSVSEWGILIRGVDDLKSGKGVASSAAKSRGVPETLDSLNVCETGGIHSTGTGMIDPLRLVSIQESQVLRAFVGRAQTSDHK